MTRKLRKPRPGEITRAVNKRMRYYKASSEDDTETFIKKQDLVLKVSEDLPHVKVLPTTVAYNLAQGERKGHFRRLGAGRWQATVNFDPPDL